MSTEEYHLGELRVALDRSAPANILPPDIPESWRVLDIGCGAGQTLIAAYPGRRCFGLDPDVDALRLGRSLTAMVQFTCGAAEALPYASGVFEFVIARVSLPYTDLRHSLPEIARVLRPGGRLWITLHSTRFGMGELRPGNYKTWLAYGYKVVNTILFDVAGTQLRVRGRYESFQTAWGITRALRRYGFDDIAVSRGHHFLVTAVRQ